MLKFGNLSLANPLLMSPLCGVTDIPFRALVREQGAALTHTQMVSCAALARGGAKKTKRIMELRPDEPPIGIQLFGCELSEMAEAARISQAEGANLISINFGCPVPKVVAHNGGSALLKEPARVEAITRAVVEATPLPVVPKIRIGWDATQVNAVEIGKRIEAAGAAGLVIHGRTRAQGYAGLADWDVISAVKKAVSIPVIGNGDLFEPQDAAERMRQTGVDGVMFGRGAMGNPWIFSRSLAVLNGHGVPAAPSPRERVATLKRHIQLNWDYKGQPGLPEMRKHAMWYLKGLPYSAQVRAEINATLDYDQVIEILERALLRIESEAETPRVEALAL